MVSLAQGDPDFATPAHISKALADAVAAGYTHYHEPYGDLELRDVLRGQVGAIAGREVSRDELVITHGGSGALAAATLACVSPGDRMLIPNPTYSLYADHVWMAGGEVDWVPVKRDFHLDLEALEARAAGARMIILCHPCNPTGAVYSRDELEAVSAIADKHDLLVLADEIYSSIVFDGVDFTSCLQIPALADRLIYVQSFSKTYAMTGWRIGYVVAPAPIIRAAARLHFALHGTLNAAVQRAALAAATGPQDDVARMRDEYAVRRDTVLEMLDGIEVVRPEGGFHSLLRYRGHATSEEMAEKALAAGVAVVAGVEFGPHGEGLLRVSFGAGGKTLEEGLSRLRRVLMES